jgi:hypothetical protein
LKFILIPPLSVVVNLFFLLHALIKPSHAPMHKWTSGIVKKNLTVS